MGPSLGRGFLFPFGPSVKTIELLVSGIERDKRDPSECEQLIEQGVPLDDRLNAFARRFDDCQQPHWLVVRSRSIEHGLRWQSQAEVA